MKERWIWLSGLVLCVALILSMDGPLRSKTSALVILGASAVACEAITRAGIAKAEGIRRRGDS